jgi:hypothetical protein
VKGLTEDNRTGFSGLTDAARELFDRNNLFEPDVYRSLFAEVEKTPEVEAAEAIERPTATD